jgi:hypothetical protein
MNLFHSSDSPFVILWYFYLIFLSIVLVVHIVCASVGRLLAWRSHRLIRRNLPESAQNE